MGVFLVLLGGIFWAISGVLAEYLFKNNYSVDWICFYRLLSTGLILIFLSFKAQKILVFTNLKESLSICMFGFFGLLLTQFGYFKAIYYTDAGTATMIQYCAPLIIMLYLCFKNKKFPKLIEIFALILIIFALFLLATKGDIEAVVLNYWGIFWAVIGAFGVAFYSLSAREVILKYGLFWIMGWASLFASFVFLLILQFDKDLIHYAFNLKAFFSMGGIVFIGTIGAFCLYLKGVEYIGALRASMIASIEPVAAALMSFLFLKTRYSLLDIFAFVLIILSVILNAKKTKVS
ncbi:DMT family transporter [Campylobacter jejuni]|nr:DMT family transporter [Campylobacter jejuni]